MKKIDLLITFPPQKSWENFSGRSQSARAQGLGRFLGVDSQKEMQHFY